MFAVLLSGGSGKRLWPLSNSLRSKQYIKILKDSDNNCRCSMVQRVWKQLNMSNIAEKTIICASYGQVEILKSQLKNIDIAIEPDRRDTFPAVVLSCAYLKSYCNASDDDVVVILPVDPYTDEDYFKTIGLMPDILNNTRANIVLMGSIPEYVSSQFGYILPDKNNMNIYNSFKVDGFVEKPTFDIAEKIISQGAVWNCGVFCFKIGYILDLLKNYNVSPSYDDVYNNYDLLPKKSFDFEILEKEKNIFAVSFNGMWKDLGTWDMLCDEMKDVSLGNSVIDKTSFNTKIINELDIPVVSVGTNNLIIVSSFDGILVADKHSVPMLKDTINDLNYPPMYEERRWGTIKVLETEKQDDNFNTIRLIELFKENNSSYHYHTQRDEVWVILKGNGEFIINNKIRMVGVGDTINILNGDCHALRALSDIKFIEIQTGKTIADADINRITLNWRDIKTEE